MDNNRNRSSLEWAREGQQEPDQRIDQRRGQPNNFRNGSSRREDSYQQKLKALGRVRYLNQLAQLEYEQKLTELHTKHSFKTKQSVEKKLRAKNQIAEFIDEEQEFGQQFEELMDYKYGASKWRDFHFEQETNKQYSFCSLCDEIHKLAQEDHASICKYGQYSKSDLYYIESLDRIKASLKRLTSQEAGELCYLAQRIKKSEDVSSELREIMPIIRNDEVLAKIAAKLTQILQQTH